MEKQKSKQAKKTENGKTWKHRSTKTEGIHQKQGETPDSWEAHAQSKKQKNWKTQKNKVGQQGKAGKLRSREEKKKIVRHRPWFNFPGVRTCFWFLFPFWILFSACPSCYLRVLLVEIAIGILFDSFPLILQHAHGICAILEQEAAVSKISLTFWHLSFSKDMATLWCSTNSDSFTVRFGVVWGCCLA